MSGNPKQTSAGDVPAPSVGGHNPPCPRFCAQCRATQAERAAVVKYLYQRADSIADPFWRSTVQGWVGVIEAGEHL